MKRTDDFKILSRCGHYSHRQNEWHGIKSRTDRFPLDSYFLKHSFRSLSSARRREMCTSANRKCCVLYPTHVANMHVSQDLDQWIVSFRFILLSLEMSFRSRSIPWSCVWLFRSSHLCVEYVMCCNALCAWQKWRCLLRPPFRPHAAKTVFSMQSMALEIVIINKHCRFTTS